VGAGVTLWWFLG